MVVSVKVLRYLSSLLKPGTFYENSFELLRELFKLPSWCCSLEAIGHSKWRVVLENAAVSGRVCAVVIDESISTSSSVCLVIFQRGWVCNYFLTEALKAASSTQAFSSFSNLPLHL